MGSLREFLVTSIGERRLSDAEVVSDNARLVVGRRRQRPSFEHSSSARSSVSLHSLPSLTSDCSVSRWDSVLRNTSDSVSPPQRMPRRMGSDVDDEGNDSVPPPPFCNSPFVHRDSVPSPPMRGPHAIENTRHEVCKKYQSPSFPMRRASFTKLPCPPCWGVEDEGEDESPTSVRVGLDQILGQALQECADLEEDSLCDDFSAI